MKLIKVSTALKVTVHEFPEGNYSEQNKALCELIGNGCDHIEHVMPKRLYTVLKQSRRVTKIPGQCVSMLVDEEFLFRKGLEPNMLGGYLYETDKHMNPILGNILFVGNVWKGDGIDFCGIEDTVFAELHKQLMMMALQMKELMEVMNL